MSRSKEIPGYLSAPDGMRALCMILIWIYHSWQQSWLTGRFHVLETVQRYGYIAIDGFFVLSGFCLFYPIARSMFGETKQVSWKTFYIKRIRRIWPSYLLLLILMIFIPALSCNTTGAHGWDYWKHFISHAFFVHNFSASTIGTTISTAWTMAIEVQFYLVFPLFAWLMKKSRIGTLIGTTVFSEGLRLYFATKGEFSPWLQSNPLLYFDIFVWGMVVAYAVVFVKHRKQEIFDSLGMKITMTVISLVTICLAYEFMVWMGSAVYGTMDYRVAQTLFRMIARPILASTLALFLFASIFSLKFWNDGVLGNPVFRFFSIISYNFYLWHQNIHIFYKTVVPNGIPVGSAGINSAPSSTRWTFLILSLLTSLVISTLITYFIERPIAKNGLRGCFPFIKAKKGAKKA